MVSWCGTHVFLPRAHKLGIADAHKSNTVTVKIRQKLKTANTSNCNWRNRSWKGVLQ